ncbi:MAG: hypothetical protein ACUVTD_07615 [Nitrososphaerales archaeon]
MTTLREVYINEKVRNRVRNRQKRSENTHCKKIGNSLLFAVNCFGSRGIKEAFEIKKDERFYTSYVFRLRASLIGILVKELASGKIDFVLVAQHGDELKVLIKAENLGKERYDNVVQGFAQSLAYEHSQLDVRAICPRHCERLSKVD